MSREKQVEEMRKDIFAAFGGYAKWEEDWQSLAEAVYNAGYRKQSEVEQIFEEIEKIMETLIYDYRKVSRYQDGDTVWYVKDFLLAELKKKYTEGEQRND